MHRQNRMRAWLPTRSGESLTGRDVARLARTALGGSARLLLLVFLLAAGAARAQSDGPPFPRLANMYLHGSVDPANFAQLARWDVLILDAAWSEADLRELRRLNPEIKIFLYVCGYCMQVPPPPGDVWRQVNHDYAQANDLWWRNWNRTIASDWPGAQLLNVTELAPAGPQGAWRQYIAARVEQLLRDRPAADGVFYDNFWKSISWEQGGAIQVDSDCNPTHNPAGCDGAMDSDALVDSLWNRAMRELARDTRERLDRLHAERGGRPLAIVTNSSADYFDRLNGTLHEYFPSGGSGPDPGNPYGYGWTRQMLVQPGGYLVAPFRTTPYGVSVLNADWTGTREAPERSAEFERHKRFTLVSALLGDGYYSLDAARIGHGNLWWEPEYDHAGRGKGYLGYPLGPMRRVGVPTGPELTANGSFASGASPWRSLAWQATGSFSVDATTYHTAPAAARLEVQSVSSGGSLKLWQSMPVQAGRGYTLTFWARASVPQEMLLHLYSESCPQFRCLGDRRLELGTTWAQYDIPFVASGTATAGLNLFVLEPGTVWLDDVSLREGDSSVYRRDFENGIVLLNYTTAALAVDLGGTFRRLDVPGSTVENGATVTAETIAPSDGRILLGASAPVPPPPSAPGLVLRQNEPNPFNPTTRIRFTLGRDEYARLAVYDIAGRLVKVLASRRQPGGVERTVTWDGTDRQGQRVRSGVYFCRLTTATQTAIRKMTLLE